MSSLFHFWPRNASTAAQPPIMQLSVYLRDIARLSQAAHLLFSTNDQISEHIITLTAVVWYTPVLFSLALPPPPPHSATLPVVSKPGLNDWILFDLGICGGGDTRVRSFPPSKTKQWIWRADEIFMVIHAGPSVESAVSLPVCLILLSQLKPRSQKLKGQLALTALSAYTRVCLCAS